MKRQKRPAIHLPNSSIVLDLHPVLKARNIQFPFAFLLKNGLSSSMANKMLKGEAVQINFVQLTAICQSLNCTPNDIFALRDMPLPENHQLNALRNFNPAAKDKTVEDWMMGKSVEEVRRILSGEL